MWTRLPKHLNLKREKSIKIGKINGFGRFLLLLFWLLGDLVVPGTRKSFLWGGGRAGKASFCLLEVLSEVVECLPGGEGLGELLRTSAGPTETQHRCLTMEFRLVENYIENRISKNRKM